MHGVNGTGSVRNWRTGKNNTQIAPFPHVIIENFLPQDVAENALRSFPALKDPVWSEHGKFYTVPGGIARKYELGHKPSFGDDINTVFYKFLFSKQFLQFVSDVTGIDELYIDSEFAGGVRSGGLNAVEKGGMLIRHVDFNFSNEIKKYRAVNVLLYLNKNWSLADGGNLDLWDKDLLGPPKTVISSFNKVLIFATNSETNHGYNEVKGNRIRRSINLYFFTKYCPPKVQERPHKTDWKPCHL
mmetsp:Transcript_11063/g.31315  ORF Transcript_11063/g.31315 Transcript_11063/m.31315 type:complete len:243 (-) Transcript_11063:2923-3651(-)